MGPGVFFPTNPSLADILGDTDFLDLGIMILAMARCYSGEGGGTSQRFLDGTPGSQNSGHPRNWELSVRTPSV